MRRAKLLRGLCSVLAGLTVLGAAHGAAASPGCDTINAIWGGGVTLSGGAELYEPWPLPALAAGDVITYSATTSGSANASNDLYSGGGFAIYRDGGDTILLEQYASSGAELNIASTHQAPDAHSGYILYGWSGSSGATLNVTVTCAAAVVAPVATSFTFGSIVAYNEGSDQVTSFNLSDQATNNPTSYTVGSATTAQGGGVAIDNTGQVSYVPPVGYRGANDSFTYRAVNSAGTSNPATVTLTVGDPTYYATLPATTATVGVAYNPGGAVVAIEGGKAPYSGFSATGLPAGLTLSGAGVISGTPTASGSFALVITATDSSTGAGAYTGIANATLNVAAAPPTVTDVYPSSGSTAGGGAVTLTGTNLTSVTAVRFGTTSATIVGVDSATSMRVTAPPAAAAGAVNVTVTSPSGTSAAGAANLYTYIAPPAAPVIVSGPPSATNATSATFAVTPAPGTVLVAALDAGAFIEVTSPVTYSGLTDGSHTVRFRSSAAGVTGADAAYSWTVDTTAPAAPVVTSPANGSSSADPTPTVSGSGEAAATVTVYLDGSPVGTTTATGGGAWSFELANALSLGAHTVYATSTDQVGNVSANSSVSTFTVVPPTIALTPTSLVAAAVGAPYSQTITASGGVSGYTYQVTAGALPAGLALASGGVLSGTPTAGGVFNVTITATDSSSGAGPFTGSRTYTLTVAAATIAVSPATLPNAAAGTAYNQTLSASGGTAPYSYAVTAGALPPGWTLSSAGVVSGVATSTGSFNFTLTATDSSTGAGAPYTGSRAYSVNVGSPNFTLTPPVLSGVVGEAYSDAFVAGGGVAPYTYSVVAGTIPPGLTLASDGVLSGAPTSSGTFGFTVVARDTTGGPGSPFGVGSYYSFTVANPAAPTVADLSVAAAYEAATPIDLSASITGVHTAVAVALAPTHGTTSVAGDVVTYTPAAGYYGADSFTFTATGPGGTSAPAMVSLTVATPAAPVATDVGGIAVPYQSAGAPIDLSGAITGVHSSVSVIAGPAHGAASVAGDVVTYTPASGYYGADSFTYRATGPGGASAAATVALTVGTPPPPAVDEPDPVVVEPVGGGEPTVVDLSAISSGVVTGFRVEDAPSGGEVSILPPAGGSTGWRLVYTPAPNFMGADVVTLVAQGPGGESAPTSFTFRVLGQAPDLEGVAVDGGSLVFEPTSGLTGGPFQGLVILRQPEFGVAEVDGLRIRYSPAPAASPARLRAASVAPAATGETSIEYAVILPFGQSLPGVIAIEAVETAPELTALTAATLAGRPVTVSLTDTATRGPFIGATVVGVADDAGAAIITADGAVGDRTYALTFTPRGDFTGVAIVTYTLSNAGGATQGVLLVTVDARPDPSQDPEVRGLMSAQVDSARRFTRGQTDNFHRRLEQVRRGGGGGASNGLSLNLGDNGLMDDPREALRAQLGQRRDGPSPFGGEEDPAALLGRWSASDTAQAGPSGVAPATGVAPGTAGQGPVGVWTAGAVDWGRRDAAGQRDYRFTTSGLSAGVDMAVSDSVVVGVGVGYGHDRSKVGDNGTLSEADSYVGAVYGSWRASEELVMDGVLGYGALEYDSRRWSADENGFLRGQRSGSVLFGSASVALERSRGSLSWAPYARISFGSIALDGFTETASDVFALNYQTLDTDTLASALGANFDWSLLRRDGVLSPNLRFEWRHEFEGADDQIVSYADWLASPDYAVGLERWARDSVSLAIGLHWRGLSGWTYGGDYQGQIGSGLASHGLRLRLLRAF